MKQARVGILGYGVIGRRLADAVQRQDDLRLVGVAGRPASFSLRDAQLRGYDVYVTDDPGPDDAAGRWCHVRGRLDDLLAGCDVLLDCTPSGVPGRYREACQRRADLVTIVQGGERAQSCEASFNAFANFAAAAGRRRLRVISCSSTGITRFAYALDRAFGIEHLYATAARRAADPAKRPKSPLNALAPTMGQSHHAADVNSVLPGLPVVTVSVDCPTTLAHVINFQADLRRAAGREEVAAALERLPRMTVGRGRHSTAELAEHYQDLGRPRGDRPEVYVWDEGIHVAGRTVYAAISVHMESITIPETIDCIRAALRLETDGWSSIHKTDRALGIAKPLQCYAP